jgi:DNA modification methylase
MQTQLVKIKDLKNNSGQIDGLPKNPRLLKDEKFIKLKKSIEDDPEMLELREVIAYNNNGELVVICGNMRLKALKELGIKEVPTKILPTETSVEKLKAYTIKDNVSFGDHDWEQLANEWDVEQLDAWGLDVPDFAVEELEAVEDDFDAEPPINPITVLGDLYEIGEHRLLCGDSTDSDQVAKLMNGEKADMVFTDPPYGNGSSGKYGRGQLGVRTILSDENFDAVNDFFNLRVCDVYVFFLQWRTFKEAIQTLENNNLQLKTIAVWDKKNAGLNGAGGMSEQWEAIIVAGNVKYSRFGGNVFSISREQKKRIDSPHPHQKPIELLNNVLEYFQDYNLLLDPFLGSGSTMVAAHQLKRKCYGMELDPKYCDVIVKRMIKLDPTLTAKRNGVDCKQEFVN